MLRSFKCHKTKSLRLTNDTEPNLETTPVQRWSPALTSTQSADQIFSTALHGFQHLRATWPSHLAEGCVLIHAERSNGRMVQTRKPRTRLPGDRTPIARERRLTMEESKTLGMPRSPSRSPKAKRTKEKSDDSRSPIKRKRRTSPEQQESDYSSSYSYSYTVDENEMPLYCEYKYGATNVDPQQWDERPKALLLFSGRPRDGDLACYLHQMGWIVVLVDLLGPVTTNLLVEKVAKEITKDVQAGLFEVVGIATPCNTVSPLRETPPGPRPLRSWITRMECHPRSCPNKRGYNCTRPTSCSSSPPTQ